MKKIEDYQQILFKQNDEEEDIHNELSINSQNEKLNNIKEIYEKTKLVSNISKNINDIVNIQEHKLDSIEGNIRNAQNKCKEGTKQIEIKNEKDKHEYSSNCSLICYLCILIFVFTMLVVNTK